MQFCDALTFDRATKSKDGYMRVVARAARPGIQKYPGREVDPEGKHFAADQVVNVYRPPEEVFDKASMASHIGRPITDDHPSVAVTAQNWRDHTRGAVGGTVKDGEWLRFDLAFMDHETVAKVDAGKRELSCGYNCDLSIEDGETADGEKYQAVQRKIRGNHVALVDRARAGPDARIADGGNKIFADCDCATIILNPVADQETTKMNFLTLDGLKVDLSDADAVKAAIAKLQQAATDANAAKDKALADVATLTTEKATLDAKVATLETQLKDAAITPAKLRDAGKAYAACVDKAKALGVTVADDMDEVAIQKAVVGAKLGDAAKDWSDVQVAASFATLTADVKPSATVTPIGTPMNLGDSGRAVRDAVRLAQF